MEEMIQSSIENMTTDLQIPLEAARDLANSFIPTLKRWQKTDELLHQSRPSLHSVVVMK
jgi:hypothetical protein